MSWRDAAVAEEGRLSTLLVQAVGVAAWLLVTVTAGWL